MEKSNVKEMPAPTVAASIVAVPVNAASAIAKKIYKVSELTKEIRLLMESRFPLIWVEGEVSNFKRATSGHIYFTLKDETAQLNAAFFSRANQSLSFELKDGLRIICIGKISVYDARGNYQLYVERVEPKGIGALQLAFLQLKEKLEKEGLFAEERKKPIPKYPKKIGIVTSPTGAAIQDMLKVFKRRHYGFHILINPVRVQGDGSALEIASAIDELNRVKDIDVIIAGRGGGSLEDLWAFNEEAVARAVARSKIPVISAVGHEIDWTICDFVADLRAHTPTAAAERVVQFWDELENQLREYGVRMQNAISVLLRHRRDTLSDLLESYAFKQPAAYVNQIAQRVDELFRQLQNYLKSMMDAKRHAFHGLAGKLNALSPLAVLDRGYSITLTAAEKLIRSRKEVCVGDQIQTKLVDGIIQSQVISTSEKGA